MPNAQDIFVLDAYYIALYILYSYTIRGVKLKVCYPVFRSASSYARLSPVSICGGKKHTRMVDDDAQK